jgi:hypothetical protein
MAEVNRVFVMHFAQVSVGVEHFLTTSIVGRFWGGPVVQVLAVLTVPKVHRPICT